MKIYFKIIIYIVIAFFTIGGLLPFLFSAESDIAVFLGLSGVILFPTFSFYYIKWVIKSL